MPRIQRLFIIAGLVFSMSTFASVDLFSADRFTEGEQKIYRYLCATSQKDWNRDCVKSIWDKQKAQKDFLTKNRYRYSSRLNINLFTLAILEAEKRYGLDEKLLLALAITESSLNPNAVSPVGAKGLFQVMPATAKWVWKNFRQTLHKDDILHSKCPHKNLSDVRLSVLLGSYYLKSLMQQFQDNEIYALASYNAGPGTVINSINRNKRRKPANFLVARNYFTKIFKLREKMEAVL